MMKNSFISLISVGLMLSFAVNVYSKPSSIVTKKSALKATGPVVDGYRVTAATDKRVYLTGEKINLVLTIRNMARDKVNVAFGSDFGNYEVNVLGPDGERVGYTPYGHEVFNAIQGGSNYIQTLDQGSERYTKVDISRYYDMSEPGKYKITSSRTFPRRDKPDQYVTVLSNPVIVTINPVKPKNALPLHAN